METNFFVSIFLFFREKLNQSLMPPIKINKKLDRKYLKKKFKRQAKPISKFTDKKLQGNLGR
jgi:hypothetical protein